MEYFFPKEKSRAFLLVKIKKLQSDELTFSRNLPEAAKREFLLLHDVIMHVFCKTKKCQSSIELGLDTALSKSIRGCLEKHLMYGIC